MQGSFLTLYPPKLMYGRIPDSFVLAVVLRDFSHGELRQTFFSEIKKKKTELNNFYISFHSGKHSYLESK